MPIVKAQQRDSLWRNADAHDMHPLQTALVLCDQRWWITTNDLGGGGLGVQPASKIESRLGLRRSDDKQGLAARPVI